MNKSNRLLLAIMSAFFTTYLSTHVQAMQGAQEQALKKSEQEMAKLFPQNRLTALAARAQENPTERNINEYFRELVVEGTRENNRKQIESALRTGSEQGFDVNFKDPELGSTPLHYVVLTHNYDPDNAGIPLLVKYGADVNSKNYAGQTPLYGAAFKNNVEAAQQLIEAGANVNLRDISNRSPLGHAITHGGVDMVQLLLNIPGIEIDREEITKAFNQRKDFMQFAIKRGALNPDQVQAFNELSKVLAPHLMTLKGLNIATIIKNIDLYRDKLHLLPQDLQDEINRRLAQQ